MVVRLPLGDVGEERPAQVEWLSAQLSMRAIVDLGWSRDLPDLGGREVGDDDLV